MEADLKLALDEPDPDDNVDTGEVAAALNAPTDKELRPESELLWLWLLLDFLSTFKPEMFPLSVLVGD